MANTSNKSRKITDLLTCRQILNIMVILGFMFNYMLRVNLTIAIVAMVVPSNKTHSDDHSVVSDCSGQAGMIQNYTSHKVDTYNEEPVLEDRFEWDEYQQNLILGCFFWGYICTELPGGRLAEIVGARSVFGYSMLAGSLLTLLTPVAAKLSYVAVIILRVLLGFMMGATWPAIPPMTAQWIPPMERSKFIANMLASSLGAAITMPICGYLISSIGWESVFYFTGVIGLIWSVAWFLLIYDSPSKHPRISPEEKLEIETAIGTTTNKGKALRVPWRSLLTSPHVWAIIITHGTSVYGYFTVVNQLPTYMKYMLSFNIKENGWLSSLPYFGKYIFAVLTSYLADYLRRSGKLTTTATRKIFTTFAVGIPGLLMLGQVFLGCDRVTSVTFFTIALTINGAVTAGYLANGLDIAPNFSGTIFGMANTLSSLGGFLSTFIVGILTYNNQTYAQWQKVFGILAGTYTIGAITFLFFGTGELQPWNSPNKEHEEDKDSKETIPLQKES